jgi:glycosyltransferase involved in cell wall biosynthesis
VGFRQRKRGWYWRFVEPRVSIVVPVLNGAATLAPCLRSLAAVDYPRNKLELIVVDNGSTDSTVELCRRHAIEPLHEPVRGAGHARNRGLATASGEVIAFTDADCEVPPAWVRELVTALEAADAVMGGIDPGRDTSRFASARAVLHAEYLRHCRKLWREGHLDRLDTANAAARRDVVERTGGFHPEVFPAEDRDLASRIVDGGGRIAFAEDVRVLHHYEPRLLPSMRKARAVGRMWARLPTLLPADYLDRHFADALEVVRRARARGVGGRVRLGASYFAHLMAAAASPGERACLRHFREATVRAIHLGALDEIGSSTSLGGA